MTDQQATSSTARTGASSSTELSDVVELVKSYARQETLGPLRGAGRWIAFGLAGALFLGLGNRCAQQCRGEHSRRKKVQSKRGFGGHSRSPGVDLLLLGKKNRPARAAVTSVGWLAGRL